MITKAKVENNSVFAAFKSRNDKNIKYLWNENKKPLSEQLFRDHFAFNCSVCMHSAAYPRIR